MRKQNEMFKKHNIDKTKPLIVLENISKQYKERIALKDINFSITAGDRIGIIGANGAGKSTLSEIIGGIRHPSSGKIIKQEDLVVGLQFQESRYPVGISVIDMLKYYLHTFNIKMTEKELDNLLITYQIKGLEKKFIQSLSGGQQQRLNILLSVIHKPDLVILDEVSTGLDIEVRSQIFEFLQNNIVKTNTAMILVSHEFNEIEKFCEKFYYLHNGEIKEAGLIKDIVAKYGSVFNYASEMLHKFKQADLQTAKTKAKKTAKNSKEQTKLISDGHNYGKNRPLILLLMKYYYKGFFVPFFLVIYPIIILFLQGFAFDTLGHKSNVHSLVGSIGIVQAMSVGIFVIPQTIIEFKNSVLMKRIGATDIKPFFFVLSVITVGFIFILLAFLWTWLWGGIFFGSKYGWLIALPKQFGHTIPYLLIIITMTLTFGMAFASLFNSVTSFIAISNVVYLPIAFLSGGFVPMSLINNNDVLKYFTYINPFKYALDPFLAAWDGTFVWKSIYFAYIPISFLLVGLFSGVSAWKLRWQA